MSETTLHRVRIIQRYNKIFDLIFIGTFFFIFVFTQYLMMREIGLSKANDWWLPDVMDMIALLFMAGLYIWGIYYRIKIGEVSIERQSKERLLKIEDPRLLGAWVIWREGSSVSDGVMSPVFLLFGVLILLMVIATWFKAMHFHGSFQGFQRTMTIQQLLIGCVFLWMGIQTWFNRVYKYRLFVRQGKTILILGIRVPTK